MMRQIEIDYDSVNSCITNSFETTDNWILDRDATLAKELGITLHPAITINNHTYFGDFDGQDIFHALCSSFVSKPSQCELLYDMKFTTFTEFETPDHKLFWIKITGLVLVINLFLFWLCRGVQKKRQESKMRKEVEMQVARYFAI